MLLMIKYIAWSAAANMALWQSVRALCNWSRCLTLLVPSWIRGRGAQVEIIYLDMSKAFDKVSHRKLLTLLQKHGFGGNLLAWSDSYLHNRLQRVTELGVSSNALPVTSRVP